jgi:hypothetical protein
MEMQAELERISGVRIQRMKDVPELITGTIPESTRGQQFALLIYSSIDWSAISALAFATN